MDSTISRIKSNLRRLKNEVAEAAFGCDRDPNDIEIMAVTKGRSVSDIEVLLDEGHNLFGESYYAEASNKWTPSLRANVKLAMIGGLQSNKCDKIGKFFDIVESVDHIKYAKFLVKYNCNILLQINISNEFSKRGVKVEMLNDLINDMNLFNISYDGIMCIPPIDVMPDEFFSQMQNLKNIHNMKVLSMGMSNDFKVAIRYGATRIRLGKSLFI